MDPTFMAWPYKVNSNNARQCHILTLTHSLSGNTWTIEVSYGMHTTPEGWQEYQNQIRELSSMLQDFVKARAHGMLIVIGVGRELDLPSGLVHTLCEMVVVGSGTAWHKKEIFKRMG